MTLSFSLKYQHLSVQHMATNAAHAQCRGVAPRRDAFQVVHSLQVLRHLAKGRGLLSRAPHRDGGFLHLCRIRLHRGPMASRFSKFTVVRSAVECSTLLRLVPHPLPLLLSSTLELRCRLHLSRLLPPPLSVRITLLPSLNLNLSLGFSFSGMLG